MLNTITMQDCTTNHQTNDRFSVEQFLPDYIPLKDPLYLKRSKITALLGPSGVGKTSVINACIDDCIENQLDFAIYTQHATLLPHKTVDCHIKLPFKLQGKSIEDNQLHQLLKDVALYHHRYKKISELSKGMQQRLQLAMAIIQDVPLYFLDEPFSSQDTKMRQQLYKVIQYYCAGKTVLIVTHCEQDLHLLTENILQLKVVQGILRMIKKTHNNKRHDRIITIPDDAPPKQLYKKRTNNTSSTTIYRFLLLGFLILLWDGGIKMFSIPCYVIPKPIDVAIAFYDNGRILIYHLLQSVIPLSAGICIAIFFSTIMSLIIYRYKQLSHTIDPFLVALQSVPVFLILPILLYVCGSGMTAKIVALSVSTFFPLFAGILHGLGRTPHGWEQQKLALKAPEYRFLYYVRLIYAIPFIWQGLRLSLIHAPLSVLAVDWIGASSGLGYLIMLSHGQLELPLMFCSLIIVLILCLCLNYGAKFLDKKFIE